MEVKVAPDKLYVDKPHCYDPTPDWPTDYLLYNLYQTWLAGYYKKPTLHISSEGGVSNETKHEHEDHTEDDADMGNEAPALFRRVLQWRVDQKRVVVTHVGCKIHQYFHFIFRW